VAAALCATVRMSDVAARYGGDEFAVILPETSIQDGMILAERIRAAITSLRVIDNGVTVGIGASLGVATLPLHARTREALIRAADQAAYAAKHTGKARVCRPEDALVPLDYDPVVLAQQLEHANVATVEALAAAVDAKDPYTRGHSHRVSAYASAIAVAMGLSQSEIASIGLAGLLHDVGKIGVPDTILTKPGLLTAAEYDTIKQHPEIGEHMLSRVPFLREILPTVRWHHERWDGGGYPDGLANTAIPRHASILAVADAFDAMTSTRTYRQALPLAEAMRRIQAGSGTQFAPSVVTAFDRVVAEGHIELLPLEEPRIAAAS
jgi:HD-GYP domain-containing protein (c-di-GMP phosphodiesterase class II)